MPLTDLLKDYSKSQIVDAFFKQHPEATGLRAGRTPDELFNAINTITLEQPATPQGKGLVYAAKNAWKNSSTGLAALGAAKAMGYDVKAPEIYKPVGTGENIASTVAGVAGDVPEMTVGSIAGGLVGAVAGTALGAETGPGALISAGTGGAIGAGAGAFATPGVMKSALRQYLKYGKIVDYKSLGEIALKEGGIGALTSFVGGKVGLKAIPSEYREAFLKEFHLGRGEAAYNILDKAGVINKWVKNVVAPAAEVATFTTAGALSEGRLPTAEEFAKNAAVIGGLHIAGKIAGKLTPNKPASDMADVLPKETPVEVRPEVGSGDSRDAFTKKLINGEITKSDLDGIVKTGGDYQGVPHDELSAVLSSYDELFNNGTPTPISEVDSAIAKAKASLNQFSEELKKVNNYQPELPLQVTPQPITPRATDAFGVKNNPPVPDTSLENKLDVLGNDQIINKVDSGKTLLRKPAPSQAVSDNLPKQVLYKKIYKTEKGAKLAFKVFSKNGKVNEKTMGVFPKKDGGFQIRSMSDAELAYSPTAKVGGLPWSQTAKGAEIEHAGIKIYPTVVNGKDYFAVQSQDNNGTDNINGDSLHGTLKEAKKEAEFEAMRRKQKDTRLLEVKKQEIKDRAKKDVVESDDVNGFIIGKNKLQKGRIKKALSKQYRFKDSGVMTVRQRVDYLYDKGNLKVDSYETNKIKEMSRKKYFGADQQEQDAHDKKVKDGGKKTVYTVYGSELGKTAYDYAVHLLKRNGLSENQLFSKNEVSNQVPKSTTDELNAEGAKIFGKTGLDKLGVKIGNGEPNGEIKIMSKDGMAILGYYDRSNKQITINPISVSPKELMGVVLHEVTHRVVEEKGWDGLWGNAAGTINKIIDSSIRLKSASWRKATEDATASLKDTYGSADKAPKDLLREETITHFLQNNANRSQTVWRRMANAIRSWAIKTGIRRKITDDDIVSMAEYHTQKMARGGEVMGKEISGDIKFSKSKSPQHRIVDMIKNQGNEATTKAQKGRFTPERSAELLKIYETAKDIIGDGQKPATLKMVAFNKLLKSVPLDVRGRVTKRLISINKKYSRTQNSYYDKAIEAVADAVDKKLVANAVIQMKDMLKKAAGKRIKSVLKGRVGGDTHAVVVKAREYINMSQAKQAEFLRTMDTETMSDDEIRAVSLVMGLKSRSIEDVIKSHKMLSELIKGGRDEWTQREEKRKAVVKGLSGVLVSEISGKEDYKPPTPTEMYIKEVADKSVKNKALNELNNFSNKMQSWEYLIDKLAKNSGKASLKSDSVKTLGGIAYDATMKEITSSTKDTEFVANKAKEIFKTDDINSIFIKNGIVNKMANVKTSDGKELPLSQAAAYPLWQIWQSSGLRERLINANKIDDSTMAQIEKFMSPETKRWAEWQMDTYYKDNYDKLNNVYENLFGVNLPQVRKYVPTKAIYNEGEEKEMQLDNRPSTHASVLEDMLKGRTENKRAFKIRNGDEILLQHIAKTNHFVAWAEPVRLFRGIFGNGDVRAAIRENVKGNNMLPVVNKFIDLFASQGVDMASAIPILDSIRANFNTSVIGLNPLITIKQLTSIPAFAADIPVKDWARLSAEFWHNPIKALNEIKNTDYMKARYREGWSRDTRTQMKHNRKAGDILSGHQSFKDRTMILTKLGDAAAIVIGGWPVYKYYYDKAIKAGKPEVEARKIADREFGIISDRTQQAPHIKDLGLIQQSTPEMKLLTMFLSSPISYTRMVQSASRNWQANKKDAAKRLFIAGIVLPAMFSAVSNAPGLIRGNKKSKERLTADLLTGPFAGIPIAREVVEMLKSSILHERFGRSVNISPALENFGKVGSAAIEMTKDHPDKIKALDKSVDAIISLFGLNYKQSKNAVNIWYKLFNGKVDRENWWRMLGYSKSAVGK